MYEEQKHIFEYIDKTISKNKKVSHAYLIETNGYEKGIEFIKEFLKILLNTNCDDKEEITRINYEIDNDIYPDIRYIYPDGNYIKKEQLLSLEKDFSKKSINDNLSIYVINEADRLNDSSANTILKFLEEPKENIIAVLVTNNRYRVLDTILSRCQILSLKASKKSIVYSEEIEKFISKIDNSKELLCDFDYYYSNLYNDRIMAINSLNTFEEIILEYINGNTNENIKQQFDEFEKKEIFDIVSIIDDEKNRLNYNVNMKLWLTDFIIKLTEVK